MDCRACATPARPCSATTPPPRRASYDHDVAYDEDLAERIRELVVGVPDVTEQRMFGGLAFLIGGNMAVAASGQGGVMVRIDPTQSARLVASARSTSSTLDDLGGDPSRTIRGRRLPA